MNMSCMFNTGIISRTNRYLTWKIPEFYSLHLNVGSEIRSEEFVYGCSRYTLVVWPRGQKGTGSEEWFGICLFKSYSPKSYDSVQFSVATALGEIIEGCTVECSENNLYRQERFMQWSDFCALSHKIAPDGCLTVLCKLPALNDVERDMQRDYIPGELPINIVNPEVCHIRTMNEPPVKNKSDDYCPDPIIPLKLKNLAAQVSLVENPGINRSSPSAINSLYSTSSQENPFETTKESNEALNPDLKMPHSALKTAPGSITFWSSFTRGFNRNSKEQLPEVALDPVGDIPEESTSESVDSFPTMSPQTVKTAEKATSYKVNSASTLSETFNSAENPKRSETNLSNSATASSKIVLPHSNKPCSVSSSHIVRSDGDSFDETGSQMRANFSNSSSSMFSGYVADSTARPFQSLSQPGETSFSAASYQKGLKILSEQLKKLYLERKEFDMTIIMAGKEFKVLRSLLKARSPFFNKLLSEVTSNVITIDPFDGCNCSVFEDCLLYIYTGEIENLSLKSVRGLYAAASNLEMPYLKELCFTFLQETLSIDTITDFLRSADGSNSELTNVALIFLAKNFEVIMNTDEWKQFTGEEPNRAIQYHLKALKIGYNKII